MELNIGTNIKRLRISKGLTQEQLADLLCVSHAAVSKWELKVTYPDITMLFPLAQIFDVSIDHLIGYDEEKAKAEVDEIVNEYHKLGVIGDFDKQRELVRTAGIKYPHDYRIMVRKMWIVAGGSEGNDVKRLRENMDEINDICDRILSGCTQDSIRADAVDMKAKLLHANGKTDAAIELLSTLPSWHSKIMIEQLFEKDTNEFRFWNKRNCYGMLDVAAIKLARTTCFDNTLTVEEKISSIECMGEAFFEMSKRKDMGAFCICEKAVYAILAGMLTSDNTSIDEIIRIRNKEFCAMKRIMNLALTDEVLRTVIENIYNTQDIIAFESHRLLNSPHPQFTSLRKFPSYVDMLNGWAKKRS